MKTTHTAGGYFRVRIFIGAFLSAIALLLGLFGSGAMGLRIFAFGVSDRNLITGTETSPKVTQSTSAVWGHGNTVVSVYEDSSGTALSPLSACGVSTSTDGGATFTRLPYKFNTGGACLGQPSIFYSVRAAKWFASFVAGRCGGNGVGLWTSPDGLNWANGSCAFVSNAADLGSIWVDNNPASPFYGTQYAAFNDFNLSGAPRVARSTNDGVTWSAPITLFAGFRRALKVTGSLGADGTAFVQTMNEGGGGLSGLRQNFIHRSTDGGLTWSAPITQGASFLGPGRGVNGYFAGMYNTPVAGYWLEMGWGEPAVGPNGVVHYAYSSRPGTGDPGNIFYVRSTDNGLSWSAPFQLNTDATTRAQWSPSVSVNAQGRVFVSWYDERNTTTDDLERFGRASSDNGATWGTEMALSDVIFPKPLQPDPLFSSTRVGIYNRTAFSNNGNGQTAYHAWTDGRVSLNNAPQQDVFFDKIDLLPAPLIVTTVDDHNDGVCNALDCTLREAINNANEVPGAVAIAFAPGVTGTIQLNGALPQIADDLIILGPGANLLTVRRNTSFDYRIFHISNNTASGPAVTISGLTITNGRLPAGGFPGSTGGGILNSFSALTINNCVITGNVVTGFPTYGGGIFNYEGTLLINNSSVTGNSAFYGGGIGNYRSTPGTASITVTNSTFSGNMAVGGDGGALHNSATNANSVAAASFTNCTFSGNQASGAFGGSGGALFNIGIGSGSATLSLGSCTLNNNNASNSGGGISNNGNGGPATVTLRDSILKSGATGANLANNGGSLTSQGNNLSNDNGGGFLTASGDQINTDPQLDPAGPANNGGPTKTIALLSTSPAINAGSALAPSTDQRRYSRNGASDIGAFEFNGVPPTPPAVAGVVSRKLHGGTPFDINLPLSGTPGVECRSGGASNDYQILVNFANPVTYTSASLSAGTGSVTSSSGNGTTGITVNLTGITSAQTIIVNLAGVSDGTTTGDVNVPVGILVGDTNGNRTVNATDIGQTKAQSGQPVGAGNFRSDVNANGSINATDIGQVKAQSGTALP